MPLRKMAEMMLSCRTTTANAEAWRIPLSQAKHSGAKQSAAKLSKAQGRGGLLKGRPPKFNPKEKPMIGLSKLRVKLTGIRPLLICNGELANPLNPALVEISKISQKKKKSIEDHQRLSKLQFEAGCYWDEELGVYLPSPNLFKALQEGAAPFKEGPRVKAGLLVNGIGSTILPDGKCTPHELYARKEHVFLKMGKLNGRASVLTTRPIFNEWTLFYDIEFSDPLNGDRVMEYLKVAGRSKGLGTWRPQYGLFNAEQV